MISLLVLLIVLFFVFKRSEHRAYPDAMTWRNHYRSEQAEGNTKPSFETEDSAMETARARLAKGELSPEEFETIKQALS